MPLHHEPICGRGTMMDVERFISWVGAEGLIRCLPGSPEPPPDWRWCLACAMEAGRLTLGRSRVDRWTRMAGRLLRSLDGPRAAPKVLRPIERALQVRLAPACGLRDEIELRVLAGQDDAAIAEACSLGAGVVEAYVRLFFDLREKLACRDHIVSTIDPAASLSGGCADIGVVARMLAYRMGPIAVDSLLGYLGVDLSESVGSPADLDGMTGIGRDVRRAVLALSLSQDEASALGVARLAILEEALGDHAGEGVMDTAAGPLAVSSGLLVACLEVSARTVEQAAGREGVDEDPGRVVITHVLAGASDSSLDGSFRVWPAAG